MQNRPATLVIFRSFTSLKFGLLSTLKSFENNFGYSIYVIWVFNHLITAVDGIDRRMFKRYLRQF